MESLSEELVGISKGTQASEATEENVGGSLEARSRSKEYIFWVEEGECGSEGESGTEKENIEGVSNGSL